MREARSHGDSNGIGRRASWTPTTDCALILDGELALELDDGKTVQLSAGDIVVQQATRHGWRNKSAHPATVVFFMLGSARAASTDDGRAPSGAFNNANIS